MDYEKYKKSRNAAWQVLIDLKVNSLPIKVNLILKALDIKVIQYKKNQEFINRIGLSELVRNSDGFTIKQNNTYIILYDSKKNIQRIRFTLAHELGHILLGPMSLS